MQGDYNTEASTEALIFKMATVRFLDVYEEKMNKRKENTVNKCCSDNHLNNYTKTIILLKRSEYC